MIRWHTLNKGITTPEKDTNEVLTERLVEKYQQTLKLHQKGRLSEAKTKYEEIADTDLVKNGTKTEHLQTRSIHITTLSMLRFLVFKNYASILEDEYEMSEMKNADVAKEALQYYLQALKIDPTEYSLWYRAGRIAQTLGNNRFARHAFQTGLFMDASQGQSAESTTTYHTQVNWEQKMENFLKCGRINPIQWQCMEGLCNVLFDIGDFNICHFYVELGLRHFPDWVLGKKLKHDMEIPTLAESMDYISESVEKPSEKAYLSINIQKLTWPDLAKELLGRFSDMTIESTSHESTVDTNSDYTNLYERIPFISKSLHINVISTEETVVARASPPLESAPAFATIPDSTTLPTPIAEQMQNPVHTETTTVPIPLIVIDEEDNDHDIATKAATSTESQMDIDHSLKRKRGEEDGVEGNAEENEAEEKRASLRASKRQREKVENEETWRRKMLQEETELSDKMQKLLDKLSPVTYLQCKEPWYIPVEELYDDTPIESFWEWFDAKVSELDRTYTWNIDKFQLQDALSCSTSSNQRRRYAIFEKSRLQPSSASNEHMDSAVLNFVQALNTNNCGIIDGLCQLAMTLLKCDNSTGLDGPLAETMVDIIIALEHNFFNMIAHDTLYDSTDDSKTELVLRVCERIMDRAIRSILVAESKLGLKFHSNGKKRASGSQHRQSKEQDSVVDSIEFCLSWIQLFERIMACRAIGEFKSCAMDQKDDPTQNHKRRNMLLRYWLLRGKMAQCNENIQDAYEWYMRCGQALKEIEDEEGDESPALIDIKCCYDSVISREKIDRKLDVLKIGNQAVFARNELAVKNYDGVISLLEDSVRAQPKPDVHNGSAELHETLAMLAEAYINTDSNVKAWECYSSMLCRSVAEFISYGCTQTKEKVILRRDEDHDFFKSLKTIDMLVSKLLDLASTKNMQEWFPQTFDRHFFDSLLVLMRVSFIYVFRHPDFIPLVNNFPVQDNPPHIPSPKTKSGGFNDTMTRIWTLQSILFNQVITSNPSLGADAYSVLAEFLLATHEELGEREICGSAKGIFLRHLLDVLIKMEDVEYRRSIYQCYHCLYGVHVAAEGDPIEEHHSPHSELTQKASEPLFALVADTIVEKVDRGSPLRSDLKDIVDIVALLFEKPPVENYRVKFNQKNIDAYLNKEIYLPQTMNQLQGTARLSTMTVDSAGSTISPVYFKIFWARGKMFRLQIKNRTKVNPERTIEDLEEAIDEFTNHLTLNPNDIRGWYELGLSLMQLAEEELIWSASNITAHKKKIAEYQKKGYHALLKAWDLSRTNSVKLDGETMFDLLNSFGYLIYSIVCRPMNMEALGKQSIRHAMGKDGKLYEVSQERVDPKLGYKMALMMFTNALRYKCADSLEWQPLYMSGKCFSKLSRPPKETLEWYHRAAQKAPSRPDQHGQEKVLEPFYKLCSTLVKYLYQGKIEPSVVSEFLESGLGVSQDTNPNTAETSCPPDETSVTGVPTSLYVPATVSNALNLNATSIQEKERQHSHLSAEHEKAYDLVFNKLSEIRKVDKRKWHHRPVYRHAWMHYYVYKNTEKAKAELSQFFTLKTNTKSPISIWKPDYERPGKHFEYVYKYTVFLVELAKASKDIDTLKQLCRKARRAQTVLLRDDEVFLAAYSAYLEIVQWQMLSCYRAQSRVDGLLNTFVNKRLFEEFCREYSNTVSKASPKPELVSLLHDLLDIRRLAHGHTSTVNVDDVVAQCYAVVLHDHGNLEQFLLAETNKTENGTEAQPAEEAKVKMTNDILIEQAKTLYSAY